MSKTLFYFPDNLAPYQVTRLNELYALGFIFEVLLIKTPQHYRPWTVNRDSYLFECKDIENEKSLKKHISFVKKNKDINNILVYGYIPIMRYIVKCYYNNKNIIMFIDNHEPQAYSFYKEVYKIIFLNRYVNEIIVPGIKQESYCRNKLRFSKIINKVPLACDTNLFSSKEYNFKSDYFLTISRFSPEKNILILIKAFRIYRNNGGKKYLKLVGDGPEIEVIEETIKKYSLENTIKIEPWADPATLAPYYKKAFAFILPSIFEPWGVVLNEALTASIPIISSNNCGGNMEVSRDGFNAVHFNPANITELVNKMLELENNEKLYTYLHEGGIYLSGLYTAKRAAFMLKQALDKCL